MKVYISVDIEGITGVTDWSETELGSPSHVIAAKQMTAETLAACQGALEFGATEIVIKDAHDTARNIIIDELPEQCSIIRGWTNTPESMVAGLDNSFDATIFIGYHSGAGLSGNPLSHSMNRDNNYLKLNGHIISEFDLNAYVSAYYGVPVVFVSGDLELCDDVKRKIPGIETVAVKKGLGNSTESMSPKLACKKIKEGVISGLSNMSSCKLSTPDEFCFEVNFKTHVQALRASFYPGVKKIDEYTVQYKASNIQDLMAARMFIL